MSEGISPEYDTPGPTNGKLAAAAKHPIIAGGLLLVGAGLAYAIAKRLNAPGEVAREVHVEVSTNIDRSPEELFRFWRDFANLPLFMKNLESVTTLDDGRTHWVAKGIGGANVEWDAEIFKEKENELIAWRSVDNADVTNAGSVRFQRAPNGRGTYLRVVVNYNPPAGSLGSTLAELFGVDPANLIKEDLRRLKQLLETGEIATIAGQTSGRAESSEVVSDQPLVAVAQKGN